MWANATRASLEIRASYLLDTLTRNDSRCRSRAEEQRRGVARHHDTGRLQMGQHRQAGGRDQVRRIFYRPASVNERTDIRVDLEPFKQRRCCNPGPG